MRVLKIIVSSLFVALVLGSSIIFLIIGVITWNRPAMYDNPANFHGIEEDTGKFVASFTQVEGRGIRGYLHHKAFLARCPPLTGKRRLIALDLLENHFSGDFAAYLNEQGRLEVIVFDDNLSEEVSFNDILKDKINGSVNLE